MCAHNSSAALYKVTVTENTAPCAITVRSADFFDYTGQRLVYDTENAVHTAYFTVSEKRELVCLRQSVKSPVAAENFYYGF